MCKGKLALSLVLRPWQRTTPTHPSCRQAAGALTPSFSRVLLVPLRMRSRSWAAFSLNTRASLPSTLLPGTAVCARTWKAGGCRGWGGVQAAFS